MSRPLVANPTHKRAMAEFHRRVFARWGNRCYWCGCHATDAAHIVPRSKLGKFRFAYPEENGRPACRTHHDAQELGMINFRRKDVKEAIHALNKVLKQKLVA